jgi:hypothetical protein
MKINGMSKKLDYKYYKIEASDESKETECTQIVICKIFEPKQKKNCLNFLFMFSN